MHFEIPDFRRCCCCIPLRYGILVFGYLNLLLALFVLSVEVWLDVRYPNHTAIFLFRGVGMHTQVWFAYLLYSVEVIFNVVLLVGAHKKNTRIIRLYYYYGVSTTLALFVIFLTVHRYHDWYIDMVDISVSFAGLFIQCYLLLLIRTELKKLQVHEGQFRFVNHMAEVTVEPLSPGNRTPNVM